MTVSKEALLTMLNDLYNQLDEVEEAIQTTFSGLGSEWTSGELQKIAVFEQRIEQLEQKTAEICFEGAAEREQIANCSQPVLKLELGF